MILYKIISLNNLSHLFRMIQKMKIKIFLVNNTLKLKFKKIWINFPKFSKNNILSKKELISNNDN